MPMLACRICGRVVYTAAAPETLFAEELRCPRCGSILDSERRDKVRRKRARRTNPPDEPGPPEDVERRISERRQNRRRRDDGSSISSI